MSRNAFPQMEKETLELEERLEEIRERLSSNESRWKAGLRLGFPEFCSHWEGAPNGTGVGWYHQLMGDKCFSTAEEAIDAAIAKAECE